MYITTHSHRMCSSLSQTSTKLIIYYVWIFSTKQNLPRFSGHRQKLHQVMRCFGLPSGTTQDYRVPSRKTNISPENMPKPTQKGGNSSSNLLDFQGRKCSYQGWYKKSQAFVARHHLRWSQPYRRLHHPSALVSAAGEPQTEQKLSMSNQCWYPWISLYTC